MRGAVIRSPAIVPAFGGEVRQIRGDRRPERQIELQQDSLLGRLHGARIRVGRSRVTQPRQAADLPGFAPPNLKAGHVKLPVLRPAPRH